jgi:hypothetical protein
MIIIFYIIVNSFMNENSKSNKYFFKKLNLQIFIFKKFFFKMKITQYIDLRIYKKIIYNLILNNKF